MPGNAICICPVCGRQFSTSPAFLRLSPQKRCSRACYDIWQRRPAADQLWGRVDKNGPCPPHQPHLGPCWLWKGRTNNGGYGHVKAAGQMVSTHRLAWELSNGPIPDGLLVLHRCDIRCCVRPDHLFLGTSSDNTWDAARKGRLAFGERHHNSKVTPAQVETIRTEWANGKSQRRLAADYGLSHSTVGSIVRRQTWKHV